MNLIGASRLILFDLDWNPAIDLQAMARVHRDGQKRPCYIYRLLTQGALDEKIFQRQVSKTGLADSIVDGKSGVSGFTREELRDLFSLDESDLCQTHTLLGCSCGGTGMPMAGPDDEVDPTRNDLATLSSGDEDVLRNAEGTEIVHLENDDSSSAFKGSSWRSAKDFEEEDNFQRRSKDSTGKAKMLSLMQYAHFDTSRSDAEIKEEDSAFEGDDTDSDIDILKTDTLNGIIKDTILSSVLREDGRRIGFVLSKLG